MRLPRIRTNLAKLRGETVQMRGVNYSDRLQPGDVRESVNLSARRWPYITTRKSRTQQTGYTGVTGLTAWDKLVAVKGTDLLYDGEKVGKVKAGEKQFAVVNTKLVIWPDKVYLDITDKKLKPLGEEFVYNSQELGAVGAIFPTGIRFWGATGLDQRFFEGDVVELKGNIYISSESRTEAVDRTCVIKKVTTDTITVTEEIFPKGPASVGGLTVTRRIPDLDFICGSENRLWGCSSQDQTVYASALGDPTNFYVYQGLSTDSYAVAVGSDGPFTGCCKLGSSVLFWKENTLHRVLGSYPAEYALYSQGCDGVAPGCHKSLQIIAGTLLYMGHHGVYAYASGGVPSLISANFGEKVFTDAVAGHDGDSYYLSVKEGSKRHLFVYEFGPGIWVREDDARAVDFARLGKELYMLDSGGVVWKLTGGQEEADMEWLCQFAPFYETAQGRKRYTKLLLRLELPQGSWLTAEVRHDGGLWHECGKVLGGKDGVTVLRVPVNRCDRFELRLRGKGPCAILSVQRVFSVGSDV